METIVQHMWSKSKLLVKALMIGMIVLILLIPTFYVQELVSEREARQKEAITEVSSKWAGKQNIAGPVLVLPYWQYEGDTISANRKKHYAYFLPDDLAIRSTVSPEQKYRGIYRVMLYTSKNSITGAFRNIQLAKLNIASENVLWNEAFVQLNISDSKGLNEEVKLNWNGQVFPMSADAVSDLPLEEGVYAKLNMSNAEAARDLRFSLDLDLSGSEQLLFTPLGKSTNVELKAKWPHPSFTGDILPLATEIKKDSFTARWKSVSQKRNYPQQWKDNAFTIGKTDSGTVSASLISNAAFGASLFVPVNGYQKTMRSVKYAVLCILLTFAAFFLIETTNKKSVHPFQYGLIGVALVLFYTLLLSFSEYTGFNIAYTIAATCTIGLIAWFVKGILSSARLSVLLSVVLLLIYTYVFTILQLQDYSLILGSIGLFITLAVIMHFSKKL